MQSITVFIGFLVSLGLMAFVLAWQSRQKVDLPVVAATSSPRSSDLDGPPDPEEFGPNASPPPTVIVNQNQMSTASAASTGPPYYYGGVAYPYRYPSVYFDEYYYRRPWERPNVYGARDGRRTRRPRNHLQSRSPSPSPGRRPRSNSPSVPRTRPGSPSRSSSPPPRPESPSRSPYILKN